MHEDKVIYLKSRFDEFNIKNHTLPNAIGMWPNEMECLLWLCLNAPSGDFMEIGSFCGGSAVLMCLARELIGMGPRVVSVDIDFNKYGMFDKNIAAGGFGNISYKLECDSNNIKQQYDGKPLSMVFIDGWHSFGQVIRDFYQIKPFLTNGAFIAFHDVSPKMYTKNNELYLKECRQRAIDSFDAWYSDPEQNFILDEAVSYLLSKENISIVDIPVRYEEFYPRETGLKNWVRGTTSPFNSLVAVQYG